MSPYDFHEMVNIPQNITSILSFMYENGFGHVPKPYGISESGMEMVSFVDGIVYNGSLPKEIPTDEILVEAAKLLRRYYDIVLLHI